MLFSERMKLAGAAVAWLREQSPRAAIEPVNIVTALEAMGRLKGPGDPGMEGEAVALLRRLAAVDPLDESRLGLRCVHCGAEHGYAAARHEPDCPYAAARAYLEGLEVDHGDR